MADTNEIWLTKAAYDRLQAELEELSGPARKEIAARIEAAREEGDLKENGGYHAAKDEQGKIEARIRELEELLKNATVAEAPVAGDTAEVGTVVTVKIFGDTEKFLLGSREIGEGTQIEVYSPESPLGAALLGKKVGQTLTYTAPNGKEITVELVAVETFAG